MKLPQRLALSYLRAKFKLLSSISKNRAAAQAFQLFCSPRTRNRKPFPRVFEQAEHLHFTLENITIRGWRWNHPAERKVLILHGFESTAVNFDRYINPLIRKGYEVLAFDAPAHGRSGGKEINAPLYKQMIQDIHQRYGPVQSYLAHSFGGLALSLAMEEIDPDSDYRLVLIAPATETVTAIDFFFRFLRLDPAIRPGFDRIIVDKGGHAPRWYSVRRALKHTRARVLWIHDEEDDSTPLADALKVKEENRENIRFVITSGLGHRRIYRDTRVVGQAVDFL